MIDCEFYNKYNDYITLCIRKYAKGPIDDYKQDIYLKLCEKQFHNENIPAFISRIVRNYFMDRFRQHKYYTETEVATTNSPENRLLYSEVSNKLEHIEGGKLLTLISEGYKYREIAENEHMNINTVKSRVRLIRMKLKKLVKNRVMI